MKPTRAQLQATLFERGVPPLWCPPLTHYTAEGAVDHARISAHVRFLAAWAKGLLVPGTTGDGWELTPEETREVIDVMLDLLPALGLHLLWGALHPDASEARRLVEAARETAGRRSGVGPTLEGFVNCHVCGCAVCPPRGAGLSQEEIEAGLAAILDLQVPLALYQLPQVTQNEMSPALAARLAARYPNFVLLKDTSGADHIAAAGLDLKGVFLVRGMEGEYARWLKSAGGCYDGFLLSSANSFGRQLHEIRDLLEHGRRAEAEALSERLSSLIAALFNIADAVQGGNKFANANKLADHFFAHGPKAVSVRPPRLHSGDGLTAGMVQAAGQALEQHQLMPGKGYLE